MIFSFSIYLSSLILTLYFAMGLQSAILTPIAACAQVNPLLMPCLWESLNNISILCPGCGSCLVCGFIYSWWTDWSQVMSPQKTCKTLSKLNILLYRFMTKMCSGFCKSSVNKNLPVWDTKCATWLSNGGTGGVSWDCDLPIPKKKIVEESQYPVQHQILNEINSKWWGHIEETFYRLHESAHSLAVNSILIYCSSILVCTF